MIAILKKEIISFFASPIGYLVISLFLLLNGLFLWIFKGQYNIFDNGFAELTPFFQITPWILLFLIPAVTMKSFSEEKKQGTLELLLTKPISPWQLVMGKYVGCFLLICISLLPTSLYILAISQLGNPTGNLDLGSTLGSYFSLILLSGAYVSLGIFCSSLTSNQIIAFLSALFLCFFWYFGFGGLAEYNLLGSLSETMEQLGMRFHYERINQGVIDTRDLVYYLSIIGFFLFLTTLFLQVKKTKMLLKVVSFALVGVLILNIFGSHLYTRIDLTEDQRFSLSEATKNLVNEAEAPVTIDILMDGNLPSEFRKLRQETDQLLEEFNAINPNIDYVFTNPLEEEEFRKETLQELQRYGLTPMEVSVREDGKTAIETVVPWAIVNYKNRSTKIKLIKNNIGATMEERIHTSVQRLEYVFADAFKQLIHPKKHKIAVLKGNGQLPDAHIADFIKTLQQYYFVGAFTLDSVSVNPQKTLDDLQKFDLFINAKPTEAFSEKEKLVMDQFIMNGGKALWMIESVGIELDSLFVPEKKGSTVAFMQDVRLGDQFFSYGARINPVLINDLYSAPLVLTSGQGNDTQFNPYPWFYASLTSKKPGDHPIVTNIEAVKFEFSNQIDTLKNNIKKTILLESSSKTKLEGVPRELRLDQLISQKPDLESYKDGSQNLAVLLEGSFKSVYKNRVQPFAIPDFKEKSDTTKMVIVADGDVIKNKVFQGKPLELGYDHPYAKIKYGNKEFLLNTINYLLDDSGLIAIRGKEINIPFLDSEKIAGQKTVWQIAVIVLPLLLLGLLGFLFFVIRKRKYER